MAEKLQFELVSPAKKLVSEPVEMVVVPGSEGDFGALAQHSPMLTSVRPGVIDVYQDGKVVNRIFVAGGFAEVNEVGCTVLAEEAIPVADLTADLVEARVAAAKQAQEDAETDLARANARRAALVAEAMKAALGGAPAAH